MAAIYSDHCRQVAALYSDHYRRVAALYSDHFRQVATLYSDHYRQVAVYSDHYRQVAALHSDTPYLTMDLNEVVFVFYFHSLIYAILKRLHTAEMFPSICSTNTKC